MISGLSDVVAIIEPRTKKDRTLRRLARNRVNAFGVATVTGTGSAARTTLGCPAEERNDTRRVRSVQEASFMPSARSASHCHA